MALEDLVGPDKFLDALVITNPEATDVVEEGDDHLRGLKNVCINSFGAMDEFMSFVADTPIILPDLITGTPDNATPANSILALVATGGRVGIGTVAPAVSLDVVGVVSINPNTPGADIHNFGSQAIDDGRYRIKNALDVVTVELQANGFSFLNGGNVGIGTEFPIAVLDTDGQTTQRIHRLNSDNTSGGWTEWTIGAIEQGFVGFGQSLFSGGSLSDFGIRALTNLAFATGGPNVRMTIDAAGAVGVGTTTPTEAFEIASGDLLLSSAAPSPALRFPNANGGGVLTSDNRTGLQVNVAGADVMNFFTSGLERARIAANGSFGIGAAAPANTLEVGDQGGAGLGGNQVVIGNGTDALAIFATAGAAWQFFSNTQFAFMPLAPGDGFVGINTTTPAARLDVNGNIFISPNSAGKNTHQLSTQALNDGRYRMLDAADVVQVELQANGKSFINGGGLDVAGLMQCTSGFDINISGGQLLYASAPYGAAGKATPSGQITAVAFGKTFATAPSVVASYAVLGGNLEIRCTDITTTGFNLRGDDLLISWAAFVAN